jgi:hypothetical protein
MKKLSGLVLDPTDDYNGAVLRSIFPTRGAVPALVKTANEKYLTPEGRAHLPDDMFALVLRDGDVTLRKYACVDAGHTALSVEYFLKTAHKLPEEAQKVAASNLCTACDWYDIEPPEALQKIALGLARAVQLGVVGPMVAKDTSDKIKGNMAVARASGNQINPNVLGGSGPPVVGQGGMG